MADVLPSSFTVMATGQIESAEVSIVKNFGFESILPSIELNVCCVYRFWAATMHTSNSILSLVKTGSCWMAWKRELHKLHKFL